MAKVRLEDVARVAGVSMKTVSNVIHDYPHVSTRTRERVQRAIDELGYRPNVLGRRLATGRTGLIALAFADVSAPLLLRSSRGVVSAAAVRARVPAPARAARAGPSRANEPSSPAARPGWWTV